jgi:hypothetical protein
MKEHVHKFIQQCSNCQVNKGEYTAPAGLLQPLLIPEEVWSSVGLDFITGLPKSKELDVTLVVVDRLTRYAHFIGLNHPFTVSTVAQAFLDNIYKLHGLHTSLVYDRVSIFTSRFLRELMERMRVRLNMSIV